MKILCVSDTVMPQMENAANLRRRYSDIDLVISCGDLPAAYLEFITSVLGVPLFYVRGNHDELYSQYPPGGEDLHRRIIEYNGLTFAGLEGSMRYNRSPIQYTETAMTGHVLALAPRLLFSRYRRGYGVDVFVAHSPAFKIHDKKDLPHRGFKAFRYFMSWYKPRYMLHGHVHTYDRRETTESVFMDTCVCNVNPVTVIEIE